ncbi:ATP-binding cassette domain-containing protein [Patescibacteria group bacterium]|nr:ATP-binding cassette domain-containing protein [Patescibacteria group bacterium]
MSEDTVKVQHLFKSFRVGVQDVTVLKDVSFEVKENDFLVIFGPSGCGKSTIMHTILGLEEPTGGSVFVLNKNLYNGISEDDRSDFRKQHVGMIYQQPNWIRSLNVVENVAFPLTLLGKNRAQSLVKAGQMLRLTKMDRWVNYYPSELSSGQQQKVALARALVTNPEIILADEPTGNLDYQSGQELMEMFTELNKNGKTVVMVTHDLNYLTFAKRAVRIFDGRIAETYEGAKKDKLLASLEQKRTGGNLTLTENNLIKAAIDNADVQKTVKQEVTFKNPKATQLKEKFHLSRFFHKTLATIRYSFNFLVILTLYLCNRLIFSHLKRLGFLLNISPIRSLVAFYNKVSTKLLSTLDSASGESISETDLVELAISNMAVKRVRTLVTVGGMMLSIGAIVFLVSVGYGLQQLVVTRVARLEEMKQADITPQTGGKIKINDKTLADFKDIPQVEMALPLLAVVGRVNYQNSVSDMAVYGVTTDYLKQSAIKPVEGKIFNSNDLVSSLKTPTNSDGQVAGSSTEKAVFGEKIQNVEYTIDPSTWVRVREGPSTSDKILGYTKRVEGKSQGEETWGLSYISEDESGKAGTTEDGKTLGKWIKAPVLLWKEQICDQKTEGDCEDGKYMVLRDEDNKQVQKSGYFAELGLSVKGANVSKSQVLGVSSDLSTATGDASKSAKTDPNASINWVDIASESGTVAPPETKTVELSGNAKREAVVNRAMLKVLGIKENEAVGKKFNVSFVVVGDLLNDNAEKIESAATEYTIVGVTPDEKTPVFYVPFIDLRSLGVTNYSQVTIVVKDQANLSTVRKQIEAMGYVTRSVTDTVAQINSLFATARTILVLLGMVALAVAALGMFNTLTVSLLERTREVGLMKAMGMKSSEVQELFLTESMIMGFTGGILGIILGFLIGKLAGLVLSFLAVFRGAGFIDISYIPFSFVATVVLLSILVGVITGIYPAKRATKISALNALRYE